MRFIVINLTIILIPLFSFGQCGCEKIKREDGMEIKQCPPSQVSSDNISQIGLSISSNGLDNFLNLIMRFKDVASNVVGDITIRIEDNNLFSVKFINGNLSYIGNSQVALAIFELSKENEKLLRNSNIKSVSFKLKDGLLHTFEIKSNSDHIKRQLLCL